MGIARSTYYGAPAGHRDAEIRSANVRSRNPKRTQNLTSASCQERSSAIAASLRPRILKQGNGWVSLLRAREHRNLVRPRAAQVVRLRAPGL